MKASDGRSWITENSSRETVQILERTNAGDHKSPAFYNCRYTVFPAVSLWLLV